MPPIASTTSSTSGSFSITEKSVVTSSSGTPGICSLRAKIYLISILSPPFFSTCSRFNSNTSFTPDPTVPNPIMAIFMPLPLFLYFICLRKVIFDFSLLHSQLALAKKSVLIISGNFSVRTSELHPFKICRNKSVDVSVQYRIGIPRLFSGTEILHHSVGL